MTWLLAQTSRAAGVYDHISLAQRVLPLSAAIIITLVTVELIRRRKLREEYSLLWFLASVVLMVFGIWPELLLWVSVVTGVYYLTIMIVICFGFLSLMVLHLAVVVSRSDDDSRKLAQRMALMERKLEESGGKEDAQTRGRPDAEK